MRVASSSIRHFQPSDGRAGVVLSIGDGAGREGVGEAAPLAGFARDDLAAAISAIRGALPQLGDLDDLGAAAGVVERALAPVEHLLHAAPSARFAIETALLDRVARRRGVPLRVAIGGPRSYDRVAVNGLVKADLAPAELCARAEAIAARPVAAIKIKLRARDDAGFARELAGLARLRAALPHVEIRLDPNAAWTPDQAIDRLAALAPIRPRYVEQPVARGELARLGPTPVPIAADESLADPAEAEAIFEADACAVYVVKPAIVGGLLRALAIAARAQALGRDVVVTHAFDGPVGFAAACELALALPREPLACGLDPAGVLAPADAARLPQLAVAGAVIGVAAPGLGLRSAP